MHTAIIVGTSQLVGEEFEALEDVSTSVFSISKPQNLASE